MDGEAESGPYILVLDAGGTGIRGLLFDRDGSIVARHFEGTPASHPEPGATEYDPDKLFDALVVALTSVLETAGVAAAAVAAIGITNQRASFCLWDPGSGRPLTNVISWQDVRAADAADRMNRNIVWRLLKRFARIARAVTGSAFLTATSMLRITTDHDTCRLRWLLDREPDLRARIDSGNAVFGTLDTWFVYRLTGGRRHVTDYTNAGATGLFNPFSLKWNRIFCRIFDIPMRMLPEVVDTNGDFGITDGSVTGVPIPIRAAVGDQQAALFGHCCFAAGDVKISQGSGAFVDINVGPKEKLSKRGLFPMIAWVVDGRPTYMLEGYVATAGTLIDWLGMGMGISNTPKAIEEFAEQCEDSEGVVFIPTPSGIRFPYFNPRMKASVLGLTLSTHRSHVARAILEGIAFRVVDILDGIQHDTGVAISSIRVDGNLSRSNVLIRCLADLSNKEIQRSPEPELTSRGAAYFAGLAAGVYGSIDEIRKLSTGYETFAPTMSDERRREKLERWRRVVQAVLSID